MGDAEVLNALKQFDEPVSAKVISEGLDTSRRNVDMTLKRLLERGEIKSMMKKVERLKPMHYYYL